ncbi:MULTISPECIES: segregation/condensation protein A [Cylindrospermopsis]|jgi:segregation and condensation protein A|uniref:segregation/condensation protein A n=1 Tax=Cylindrospermopsis TaxID=77021 RepID=UPI000708E0A5|nr:MULTISPECIES: ScpA family protein [Cylindrospermopsis]MBU6344708.1 segregation/condensation protein A [Cyanobacteria bacterium REEB494]KRH97559.1 chromosome segregation protein ScpA [Cylindrospermopsis sp. CR12]TPX29703.1 segregation/condensation protein A [Cylindrospermopsis raciborskii GIHE 2018]UJL32869.1 segregation/condensation protein A [Cylindrospermopsis raciborskii Cr2010]UJS05330.1 segregation/condensation protein A [Cylindrospermopsis raciborskii KLL07]
MDAKDLLATINNLIEQAKRGEIDPWNVEVVEVIDRYLEFMSPQGTTQGYESDLHQSGQAFLSASMLVLFKANTLMELSRIDSEIDNSSEDVVTDDNNTESHSIERLQLERQLRRRTAAMPPPKRRVTLVELIEQLQIMASQLKEVEKPNKSERPRRQPTMKTMKAALELAHQENLTQVAVEVEQVLLLAAKEENSSEPSWGLEELVELWSGTQQANQVDKKSSSEHNSEHGNLVSVFWALLLLCAQSKVELFQEEFYQEVKVRLLRQK